MMSCFFSISKCCVLTHIAFFLSAMIGAPCGPQIAVLGIVDLVLEAPLFPISFRVLELVGALVLYQIICECCYHASLAFLTYRRSEGNDSKDVPCVDCFLKNGNTGDVVFIP